MLHRPAEFVGVVPFRSRDRYHPDEIEQFFVWSSLDNLCDNSHEGACDTAAGIYYGEHGGPWFCPLCFYAMHLGENPVLQPLYPEPEE